MNDTLPLTDATSLQRVTRELVQAGLTAGMPFRVRVATTSMAPSVRPGDELIVVGFDWRDLRAGDIVLCQSGQLLLAHRLVAVQPQVGQVRLITKGDATWNCDPPSPLSAYLGKVVRVERAGRSFDLDERGARVAARYHWTISLMKATAIQLYHTVKQRLGYSALLVLSVYLLLATRASAAVTVSSFAATGGQAQIIIKWTTALEKNNFGFNLERSTDAKTWAKIAFVQSQSPCIQSLTTLAYQYIDGNLPPGTKYYYQLKLQGKPCGDPDETYQQTVSATTNTQIANPTAQPTSTPTPTRAATATSTPQDTPTATPLPTDTSTPQPGATATNTPLPTATSGGSGFAPTSTPTATNVPARNSPTPTRRAAPGAPSPTNTVASSAPTTAPNQDKASPTPLATQTQVAVLVATEAPVATAAPASRRPAQAQPTAQPTDATGALVGVGLVTVLGMGAFGVLSLALAGVMLWRYYVRR